MTMKMTMAEFVGLEPCPFCGGEAEMLTAESMNGGYLFGIMCNDCRSRGDVYDTESEAIEAWNSRAERTCKMRADGAHCMNGVEFYECRSCGEYACIPTVMGKSEPPNYCPNCGAKAVKR